MRKGPQWPQSGGTAGQLRCVSLAHPGIALRRYGTRVPLDFACEVVGPEDVLATEVRSGCRLCEL
jgi:hypothetical protein